MASWGDEVFPEVNRQRYLVKPDYIKAIKSSSNSNKGPSLEVFFGKPEVKEVADQWKEIQDKLAAGATWETITFRDESWRHFIPERATKKKPIRKSRFKKRS